MDFRWLTIIHREYYSLYRSSVVDTNLILPLEFKTTSKTLIFLHGRYGIGMHGLVIRFLERHGSHLGTQNFDLEFNYP